MDQRQLKEGGLLIHRLQTPLLFFLELIAILLIVLAAAGPRVQAGPSSRPLIIVLDDSFSMLAGGADSPRRRAEKIVKSEMLDASSSTVHLVLAGESPQMLGEATSNEAEVDALLEKWRCFSPTADLQEGITFAFALSGERSRVLVVTDQKPPVDADFQKLEWRAFGRSQANIAFVNATRTSRDGHDRCLLEIANLSDKTQRTVLVIENRAEPGSDEFQEIRRSSIELAANGTERIVFNLKPGNGPLRARLDSDSLTIDNEVTLLPNGQRPVKVEIDIEDGSLRGLVENAISASTTAELDASDPDLTFTDKPERGSGSQSWIVRISADKDSESFIGPFVINRSHPLSEGLSLDGVIWGAGKSLTEAGSPVILAGNTPLASDVGRADGAREIRFSFRPDLSTLQRTPAWPILIWNLLSWRASELPGVDQSNVRLGSEVMVKLPSGAASVEVIEPGNTIRSLAVLDRTVSFKPDAPGIYQVDGPDRRYHFAANALRKEESDLIASTAGNWGGLDAVYGDEREQKNIAWIFLLLLLLVLAIHLFFASQSVLRRGPKDVAGEAR